MNARTSGKPEVWQLIQSAVLEENPSKALEILRKARIRLDNGMMMQVFDTGEQRYNLPPFVLSEPVQYGQGEVEPSTPKDFSPRDITFRVRSPRFAELEFTSPNDLPIHLLKEMIGERTGKQPARLLFNGKDLKHHLRLSHYRVTHGVVLLSI